MAKNILYCCPNDKYVLHTEDVSKELKQFKIIIPERPMTCPKCGKSIYKYECITLEQ